jgi:hypothetical protein
MLGLRSDKPIEFRVRVAQATRTRRQRRTK